MRVEIQPPGMIVNNQCDSKSNGADYTKLLELAHLQACQTQYRFRGLQDELMNELPPGLTHDKVSPMLVLSVRKFTFDITKQC